MRTTPIGQKWVVYYNHPNGERHMGLTDHYKMLPNMITELLLMGCSNIQIIDETIYKDDDDGEEKNKPSYIPCGD